MDHHRLPIRRGDFHLRRLDELESRVEPGDTIGEERNPKVQPGLIDHTLRARAAVTRLDGDLVETHRVGRAVQHQQDQQKHTNNNGQCFTHLPDSPSLELGWNPKTPGGSWSSTSRFTRSGSMPTTRYLRRSASILLSTFMISRC